MKKKRALMISLIAVVFLSMVSGCWKKNRAFLDTPKINTCTTENSEINLQIRYFTNYYLDVDKYNNCVSVHSKNSSVSLEEQRIEHSESFEGINVYYIHLRLKPLNDEDFYSLKFDLDKEYTLDGLTNKNFERDPKNLFRGMDYINRYRNDMPTYIYIDESVDVTKVLINNMLNEINKNEVLYEDGFCPQIIATGNIQSPQIIGYTYTYDNKTFCADNEIQYKEYTVSEIKDKLK